MEFVLKLSFDFFQIMDIFHKKFLGISRNITEKQVHTTNDNTQSTNHMMIKNKTLELNEQLRFT